MVRKKKEKRKKKIEKQNKRWKSEFIDIPSKFSPQWKIRVDGRKPIKAKKVVFTHPQLGKVMYGFSPCHTDAIQIHEHDGGGVALVIWTRINGDIYIAMVYEERYNQKNGGSWNIVRGFFDPQKTARENVVKKLHGEMGLYGFNEEIVLMQGLPMNPNSAFFDTSYPTEGVKFYKLYVNNEKYEFDPYTQRYRFKPGVLLPFPEKTGKIIDQGHFFYWKEALKMEDMFTVAAVARLIAEEG